MDVVHRLARGVAVVDDEAIAVLGESFLIGHPARRDEDLAHRRRIGRLEYRVDALSEKLDEIRQLMRDGARGVAAAPATITATEAPMPAPMAAPVVDSPAPSALTLHAREVLERLLQVRAEGVH